MRKLFNGLVGGLLLCAGASSFANQVLVENADKHSDISVEYKLAYKNPGEPAIFSGSNTTQLGSLTVNVPAKKDFQKAGVVIVAVNGVKLPNKLTNFDQEHGCFAVTDKIQTESSLQILYRAKAGHHGSITCMSH